MQKIIEPIGFLIYLIIVLYMGIYMYRNHKANKVHMGFASLALTLALVDATLMLPRIYAIWTDGIEEHLKLVGIGRIGQALILCLFYAMINDLYKTRFELKKKLPIDKLFYFLLIFRVVTVFFPQNKWFDLVVNKEFLMIRTVPIIVFALLMAVVIGIHSLKRNDLGFLAFGVFMLLGSIFIEPSLLSGESVTRLYVFTAFRGLFFVLMLFVGFSEVRKENYLSRF